MTDRLANSGVRRAAAEVADIDVTPVMNMFIILIPFLVSMAGFSHLGAHDLTVAGGSGRVDEAEAPVTITLDTDEIVGVIGSRSLFTEARLGDGAALDALSARLMALDVDRTTPVVVAVGDSVSCADLVHGLDACKSAGFARVSVAEVAS